MLTLVEFKDKRAVAVRDHGIVQCFLDFLDFAEISPAPFGYIFNKLCEILDWILDI